MMPIQANWMMFVEFGRDIPALLVCITAYIVCRMRWKDAPRASLFCLLGFGLIAFNAIFGVIVYGLVLNLHLLGGTHFVLALHCLNIARVVINAGALVLLLIAAFSDRPRKTELSPFERATGQPAAH